MAENTGDIEKEMNKDFKIIEDDFGVKWINGHRVLAIHEISENSNIVDVDAKAPPEIILNSKVVFSTGWM